jgi:hypothetical protein
VLAERGPVRGEGEGEYVGDMVPLSRLSRGRERGGACQLGEGVTPASQWMSCHDEFFFSVGRKGSYVRGRE